MMKSARDEMLKAPSCQQEGIELSFGHKTDAKKTLGGREGVEYDAGLTPGFTNSNDRIHRCCETTFPWPSSGKHEHFAYANPPV